MLELAKRALNEESIELAAGVFAKDNLLDEINAGATGIIADYITEHPEAVHTGVDLVSVFRSPSNRPPGRLPLLVFTS